MEEWKDIAGWEGVYQISSHGRIKSFKDKKEGRILSNQNKTGGYFNVVLCQKGKRRLSIKIHRLVAIAFIPNPQNKPEVNHKDGNKQNNNEINLEWATRKENALHSIEKGLANFYAMNIANRFIRPAHVIQKTMDGRTLNVFQNCTEAHKATGVCTRNIHQVASKTEYKPGMTRKQAGGFRWEYAGI